jgi:predicted transcriptional regulator
MRDQEYLNPEQCRLLRERLKYLGMTQKELAEKINVSEALFSRIARGKDPCTADLRKSLEQLLDLEPGTLSATNSFLLQGASDQGILQVLKILLDHVKLSPEMLHALQVLLKNQYPKETSSSY